MAAGNRSCSSMESQDLLELRQTSPVANHARRESTRAFAQLCHLWRVVSHPCK
jgi:hypothetical protein